MNRISESYNPTWEQAASMGDWDTAAEQQQATEDEAYQTIRALAYASVYGDPESPLYVQPDSIDAEAR